MSKLDDLGNIRMGQKCFSSDNSKLFWKSFVRETSNSCNIHHSLMPVIGLQQIGGLVSSIQ